MAALPLNDLILPEKQKSDSVLAFQIPNTRLTQFSQALSQTQLRTKIHNIICYSVQGLHLQIYRCAKIKKFDTVVTLTKLNTKMRIRCT